MTADDVGWAAVAEAHLLAGRVGQAETLCVAQLAVAPGNANVLSLLSFVRMKQGRWDEAEVLLRTACALHPTHANLHATLAGFFIQHRRFGDAVEPLQTCVLLEPRAHQHRANLVAIYESRQFTTFTEEAKRAMLACLADDDLTHSLMSRAWLSLIRLDPESADVWHWWLASADYASFRAGATAARWSAWQANDLLNGGLTRFLVADTTVERALTFARRWLFEAATAGADNGDDHFGLLCVLARACFFAEYVFATAEDPAVLRDDIDSPKQAALLACYEPLFAHPEARRLAMLVPSDPRQQAAYRELVRIQIHEPSKEIKLKATIPALGPIEDAVSLAVRAQYEESPYPRWASVGHVQMHAMVVAAARHKHILVAGCGTGREAVDAALAFPAARVDALDLSRTSLAYGVRKARELGAGNAFFIQGDILEARRLKKKFDLIVSSGVLHHMDDPRAGLRSLLNVLRPGGLLKLALYSTRARTEITAARIWAAQSGWAPDARGIRAFRAAVLARPNDDSMKIRLTAWDDFYSLSSCRDLVFHSREHTFTLLEIAAIFEEFGLTVIEVAVKNPAHLAAYHQRFADDKGATSLANWHAFEQEQPNTFASMYSFWVCRADETDAVDFAWIKSTGRM